MLVGRENAASASPTSASARSLLGLDGGDDPHQSKATMGSLNAELTATGTVLGTPRYMAPEQLVGPDIDHRADQFSFCVALYEALYDRHPLPGSTSVAMLERGERAMPPPAGSDVPAWVAKVVARGLERERNKRYPSMAELMAELAPVSVRSRARLIATLAAAMVIVGGSTAAALEWGNRPGEPEVRLDQWSIQELNRIQDELKTVTAQRNALEEELEKADFDHERVKQMEVELKKKDDQVNELVKQVIVLKSQLAAMPRPLTRDELVSRAVEDLRGPIKGCFLEWTDRNPLTDVKVVAAR